MADNEQSLERLVALIQGFRSTQVTYVIAKLGLADHLAESPLTAAELGSRVNVNGAGLGRVLRLAAFYGLVAELPGERFELTAYGRPLCSEVEGSIKATATMLGEEHYIAWGKLIHSVKTGERSSTYSARRSLTKWPRIRIHRPHSMPP